MTDTVTVRVVRNQFYHDGEVRTEDSDPFEVSEEIAEDHPRTLEETESGSDSEENPAEESQSETDDGYTCVGNDGECSRPVDEEGGLCWQHE